MESMGLCSVKTCQGNFAFDYIRSDSVGCVAETGVNLLIVAVYTPYDLRDKLFNVQGADVFNSFIANAGLEEVPLGENTWSEAPSDDSSAMRSMMRKLKYLKVISGALGFKVSLGLREVQLLLTAAQQRSFNSSKRVVDAGMFMGIKLSPLLNLSHMFYADDAVFVGQWCDGNINTLVHVLECFYRALGLRIIMSKNNWIGGNVLKDLYPRIYALETFKSVIVSKKLTDSSLDNSFNRKTWGGVEQVQYNALSDMVHAVTLVPLSDRWVWSLESSREFSVASVRKVIDEKWLSNVTTMTRWIKCVSIKVNVLA
nr:RNA-directed DNA polymerase, eukaryota [Tanacetum cinerariifolium]